MRPLHHEVALALARFPGAAAQAAFPSLLPARGRAAGEGAAGEGAAGERAAAVVAGRRRERVQDRRRRRATSSGLSGPGIRGKDCCLFFPGTPALGGAAAATT